SKLRHQQRTNFKFCNFCKIKGHEIESCYRYNDQNKINDESNKDSLNLNLSKETRANPSE
ncbi:MAG: hypothetical protein ACRCTJ_01695, partial [Brevinema sp.]